MVAAIDLCDAEGRDEQQHEGEDHVGQRFPVPISVRSVVDEARNHGQREFHQREQRKLICRDAEIREGERSPQRQANAATQIDGETAQGVADSGRQGMKAGEERKWRGILVNHRRARLPEAAGLSHRVFRSAARRADSLLYGSEAVPVQPVAYGLLVAAFRSERRGIHALSGGEGTLQALSL